MKVLDFLILIVLLAILGIGLWLLYENLPLGPEKIQIGNFSSQNPIGNYSKSMQFYPNMRYTDSRISYKIEDSCSNKKKIDIEGAFEIISEKTILRFYTSDTPEIDVLCSNIAPTSTEKDHFVAGEGGPSEIINTSVYSVILSGKVALYRSETCDAPQVAIHEILHSLGFDHTNNPHSIMYPVTDCNQEIDQSIIDDINSLYSIPSAPDLTITYVSATTHNRYLDFNITVSNIGLKNSTNSDLSVSAEGSEIKKFYLNETAIGVSQKLEVENLRIPKTTNKIYFIVETSEPEISKSNNQAEITLS